MLIEQYNEDIKMFECFNSNLKWWAFTGYGKTKKETYVDCFSKPILKNRPSAFITSAV